MNVGEIENRGWEMQPAVVVGPLSLTGTVSLVESRVRAVANGYEGDLRPGDRMLGVPSMTTGLTVAYAASRTSASIGLSHARDWVGYDVLSIRAGGGDEPGVSLRDNWVTYPGATHLRASLSRDVGRRLTMILTGENLLDQPWGAPDNGTLVPGRSTTVGLRFHF